MLNEKVYVTKVNWLKSHPRRNLFGMNRPLCIWSTICEQDDMHSFVLTKLIQSHFVCIKENVTFAPYNLDIINIIVPLPSKSASSCRTKKFNFDMPIMSISGALLLFWCHHILI